MVGRAFAKDTVRTSGRHLYLDLLLLYSGIRIPISFCLFVLNGLLSCELKEMEVQ